MNSHIPIERISTNPANPRTISDEGLGRLVQSVLRFPKMMEKRGLAVADGVVIGGNMRLAAVQKARKRSFSRRAQNLRL